MVHNGVRARPIPWFVSPIAQSAPPYSDSRYLVRSPIEPFVSEPHNPPTTPAGPGSPLDHAASPAQALNRPGDGHPDFTAGGPTVGLVGWRRAPREPLRSGARKDRAGLSVAGERCKVAGRAHQRFRASVSGAFRPQPVDRDPTGKGDRVALAFDLWKPRVPRSVQPPSAPEDFHA